VCSVALGALCLTLFSRPVLAEMYVAGQVGLNIPYNLSNVEWRGLAATTLEGNDLALQNSVVYGAKLGYFFDSLKAQNFNLGVETEAFNATPHIKQQDLTVGGVNFGTIPGFTNRVLTWAPVNIVVRYQAGAFEPYAGVGLGVFFSRIARDPDFGSSTSTDVGLNTQLGLRYRLTTNFAVFGEWKFNHANLSHDRFLGAPGLEVSADYNAHNLVFGVGYHF
jgi:opacity protein-like surface antigen